MPPAGIADFQRAGQGQPSGQHGALLIAKEEEAEIMHLPSAPSHLAEPRAGGAGAMMQNAEPLTAFEEPLPAS